MSCPSYIDDEKYIKNLPFKELYYYERHGQFDEFEFILITFSNKFDYDINNVKKEYRYKKYIYNTKSKNKLFYSSLFLALLGIGICYFEDMMPNKTKTDNYAPFLQFPFNY